MDLSYLMYLIAFALVGFLFYEKFKITLEGVWEGIRSESMIVHEHEALLPESPGKYVRVSNRKVDVIYWKTLRKDRKVGETIEMRMIRKRGHIIITFVDEKIWKWTSNGVGIPLNIVHPTVCALALRVLRRVRSEVPREYKIVEK